MKADKRSGPAKKSPVERGAARVYPEAYTRVHALWVAVRAVAHHEDELCTLMHEIKRSGSLSDAVRGELRKLLEEMPVGDVVGEAEALGREIGAGKRTRVKQG